MTLVRDEFDNHKRQVDELESRIKTLESRALTLAGTSFVSVLMEGIGFFILKNTKIDAISFMLVGNLPLLIISQILLICTFIKSPNLFPKEIIRLNLSDNLMIESNKKFEDFYNKYVKLWNLKSNLTKIGASFLISFLISTSISIFLILFSLPFISDIWFSISWFLVWFVFAVFFTRIFESFSSTVSS